MLGTISPGAGVMMRCWSDGSIERAAFLMADAGIAPGCAPGAGVSADLVSLLEHADSCADCRKRLHMRFDAVILMRARQQGTRIPLHIAPHRAVGMIESVLADRWAETYPLAAQTSESGIPAGRRVKPTRVLTLTTGDDRFLVRVFANDVDPGATAVLFPVSRGVTLDIGGATYAFDESGCASLPGFPGGEISLIL